MDQLGTASADLPWFFLGGMTNKGKRWHKVNLIKWISSVLLEFAPTKWRSATRQCTIHRLNFSDWVYMAPYTNQKEFWLVNAKTSTS